MSRKKESEENIARRLIEAKVQLILANKQELSMYAIEKMIYQEMDKPDSGLSITNFYKLKNYFQGRYFTKEARQYGNE